VRAIHPNAQIALAGLELKDEILLVNGAVFRRPADLDRALLASGTLDLRVLRDGNIVLLHWEIPAEMRPGFSSSIAFGEKSTRIAVTPGLPAARASFEDGDRILRIADAEVESWADVLKAIARANGREVTVELQRRTIDEFGKLTLDKFTTKAKPEGVPSFDVGLVYRESKDLIRATGAGDAISRGFGASIKFVKQIMFLLKKMALGDVPAKDYLGGPISIAAQSYHVAQHGFVHLLYFLAILSLNLGLINLLPIPVLDGGNLLFVVVEAVKGSPVSDRVLGASQTVGLFLLIALMVWVTFHDVRRVFGVFS
jgi:regulator of sigma E protease